MTDAAFCAVEGVDGSGKTGVVRHLVDHLRQRGCDAFATREPGGTMQGERIRTLILSGQDDAWNPMSELLLMTAARIEHVTRVILPALLQHRFVVSDRFVGSTIAYQGAGRGISEELIRQLHISAVGNVWPSVSIILDLDVETSLSRSRNRLTTSEVDEGRFESLDTEFHRRIRRSFLDQAERDPDHHIVVDASGTPDEVKARAAAALDSWIERRPL